MKWDDLQRSGYYLEDEPEKGKPFISREYYNVDRNEKTIGSLDELSISASLPADIDIFSELPDYVYDNPDARKFVHALKKMLVEKRPDNVTLSKMRVSEHTESGVVIDWIYNYFRVYFSFDKEDGNFYGITKNSPGSYSNQFELMKTDEFEDVARYILDVVIQLIRGDKL